MVIIGPPSSMNVQRVVTFRLLFLLRNVQDEMNKEQLKACASIEQDIFLLCW